MALEFRIKTDMLLQRIAQEPENREKLLAKVCVLGSYIKRRGNLLLLGEDAKRMLEYTGCDGVMVGRGAQGNPFIFRQILEYLKTGTITYFPTDEEKIKEAIHHVNLVCEIKGENRGVLEARKHIAWYIKGIPHSNELKTKVFTISKQQEMLEILDDALKRIK